MFGPPILTRVTFALNGHAQVDSRRRRRQAVITAPFVVRRAARLFGAIGLSLMCAAIARAQTRITGVVTDSAGGFPVSGVSITVSGSTLGALTNDDGRYTITGVA